MQHLARKNKGSQPSNRREFLRQACTGVLGLSLASVLGAGMGSAPSRAAARDSSSASGAAQRPNIIVIMADDMGYSDIGCYGGEVQTPNLDQLAADGLRFTQFYNAARCCPTRASILTGLYPHQAGVGAMVGPGDRPGYRGRLNESCVTFAEVLKEAGYQTFMSGKWHVTHFNYNDPEPTLHRESWPRQRGFDRFFGTLAGGGSFFTPVSLMRENEFIEPGEDFYYTDAINDQAVEYIQEADPERPFLMYVSHVAPHWPLHALPEDIAKYEGVYDVGWDVVRERRHERMKAMGLVDPQWPLTPRDSRVPAWEEAENKDWEAHRMAVYAAQVDNMDQGIGRIMAALKAQGQWENTLILFLSDNGGSPEVIQGQDTRHGYFERGGTTPEVMPGAPDTYASYGVPWANASNTPYRRYKAWIHEGGSATPLIAHWPEVISGDQITHEVGHIIDIMATCVDLADASYPEEYNGHAITPLEGKSLLPLFQGQTREGHEALYWEHLGKRGMRAGKWKIVGEEDEAWELYDLEADRVELNNLADADPERVEAMVAQWQAWAERCHVL